MLAWNEIETVLLDMDGTLLDLHFDNHFWQHYVIQRYAEQHRVPINVARPKLLQKMSETRGSLDWYCLDFWSRELNLNILALKREIDHLIAVHDYAEEFLQALHGRKLLALVTNAHPDALQLKLEKTGINIYFDHILSSHEFRLPKEDPDFWRQLQSQLAFDPNRTLLVEDSIAILHKAREFGIRHLLAIKQADSRAEPSQIDDFPAIFHFGEILPLPPD